MDVKVPEIGESIHEALIAEWLKEDGATIAKDDNICELETDKINIEVPAEVGGMLHIKVKAGETVEIGTVIATIEEGADGKRALDKADKPDQADKADQDTDEEDEAGGAEQAEGASGGKAPKAAKEQPINPAARRLAREQGIDLAAIEGSGRNGRITLEDVEQAVEQSAADKQEKPEESPKKDTGEPPEKDDKRETAAKPQAAPAGGADASARPTSREAMTPIRQRIAARLLEARQQTAMLTTFNEADMAQVKDLRSKHQEHFTRKHGIKLGLMSFFVKATIEALKAYPAVNARIDGQEIVYHHYYDIGIAVGTDRGLVVPVLRDASQLTFAEIEQGIAELATKAQERKLTLADLEGGTFTISNGGIYGSLLSTPIINPPQTGVLGMHAIQDRPVVRDGEIVIRPIMYLALSYDHRLIDGREAVGFLKLIKEYIEDPEELLLEL